MKSHLVEFHQDLKLTTDAASGTLTLTGKVTTVRPYTCLSCRGLVKLGNAVIPVQFSSAMLQSSTAHTYAITCSGKSSRLASCPSKAIIELDFVISNGSTHHFQRMVHVQQ